MAEGFAQEIGRDILDAYSAGSRPSGNVNPTAVKVMQEIGIDIFNQKSKGFTDLPVKEFDYVVTLGCQDVCPFVPAKEHLDWQISDPKNKDIEFFRNVRDDIKNKVVKLIENIRETK